MTITMTNNSAERSLAEIRSFLTGADCLEFKTISQIERNDWMEKVCSTTIIGNAATEGNHPAVYFKNHRTVASACQSIDWRISAQMPNQKK